MYDCNICPQRTFTERNMCRLFGSVKMANTSAGGSGTRANMVIEVQNPFWGCSTVSEIWSSLQ